MKISPKLKLTALTGMTLSFAIGCASTTETAPEPTREPEPAVVEEKAPEPAPAPVATPEPAPADTMTRYEVERGDSLWSISGKSEIYGNPYQWPLIYKANSDKIRDADLIYPGQQFDIETSPAAAEVSAAIEHAKTRGSWTLGVVEETDKAYLAQ